MANLVTLNTPNKQGVSRRATLESTIKQLRKAGTPEAALKRRFKELEPIKLAPNTGYLLSHFNNLSDTRMQGFDGPLAITYLEIQAYASLMQVPEFTKWEVEAIVAMDSAYLRAKREMNKAA